MHSHFGYDVSETMHNIRALFARHCKNLPKTGLAVLKVEKDRLYRSITRQQITEAVNLLAEGIQGKEIARRLGISDTTVTNIARRKRRFKDLPVGDLTQWFEKHNVPSA